LQGQRIGERPWHRVLQFSFVSLFVFFYGPTTLEIYWTKI
jgi:hypothetical protein